MLSGYDRPSRRDGRSLMSPHPDGRGSVAEWKRVLKADISAGHMYCASRRRCGRGRGPTNRRTGEGSGHRLGAGTHLRAVLLAGGYSRVRSGGSKPMVPRTPGRMSPVNTLAHSWASTMRRSPAAPAAMGRSSDRVHRNKARGRVINPGQARPRQCQARVALIPVRQPLFSLAAGRVAAVDSVRWLQRGRCLSFARGVQPARAGGGASPVGPACNSRCPAWKGVGRRAQVVPDRVCRADGAGWGLGRSASG